MASMGFSGTVSPRRASMDEGIDTSSATSLQVSQHLATDANDPYMPVPG